MATPARRTDRRSHGGGRRAHRGGDIGFGGGLGGHHQQRAYSIMASAGRRSRASSDFSRPSLGQRRPAPLLPARLPCLPSRAALRDGCLEPAERHDRPSPSRRNGHPCRGYPMGTGADRGPRTRRRRGRFMFTIQFNVAAMDSHSVQQFLKNNSKQIMRTIDESVRTGSHIGLAKLRTT